LELARAQAAPSILKSDDVLRKVLAEGSLHALTKALRKFADSRGYELKAPYTELLRLSAHEERDHFVIDYAGKLYLHYVSLQTDHEGLVISVTFSGRAIADSASPPFQELFYDGRVDLLKMYGYGPKWTKESIRIPKDLAEKLDLHVDTLAEINVEEL